MTLTELSECVPAGTVNIEWGRLDAVCRCGDKGIRNGCWDERETGETVVELI